MDRRGSNSNQDEMMVEASLKLPARPQIPSTAVGRLEESARVVEHPQAPKSAVVQRPQMLIPLVVGLPGVKDGVMSLGADIVGGGDTTGSGISSGSIGMSTKTGTDGWDGEITDPERTEGDGSTVD
jgi:hypothetical protein